MELFESEALLWVHMSSWIRYGLLRRALPYGSAHESPDQSMGFVVSNGHSYGTVRISTRVWLLTPEVGTSRRECQ